MPLTRLLPLALALAAVLGVAGATRAATTGIVPNADAYVTASAARTNYGSATELRAGSNPDTRSYLRFDASRVSGKVRSATLWLYAAGSSSVGYEVHAVTGKTSFSEKTLTYQNAPAIATAATVVSGAYAAGWTSVDVTPLVKAGSVVAVAVTSRSATTLSFASREVASTPPRLDVVTDTTAPTVTLTSPAAGSTTNVRTPTFGGVAGTDVGDSATVTVKVWSGTSASGTPVQTLGATRDPTGAYAAVASSQLADGTYTVQASQADDAGHTGTSAAITFRVDATPPAVTLTAPVNGSWTTDSTPTFAGGAGTVAGDGATITVSVYAGTAASGTPVQTLSAQAVSGAWSVDATTALADGTYTARAAQSDSAGNVGRSAAATFSVGQTPPPPPPTTYANAVAADAPVSYWRLGESSGAVAADAAGVNPGTYNGGVTLGQPGALVGDPNTAASFDGLNDYVSVPDSSSLDLTTAASVEVWVQRRAGGVWQALVAKPGNAQSQNENYALWLNSSNYPVAYFGDGTSYVSVTSPTPLDTAWHHLVATYDNATARLYVDGSVVASTASTIRLTANSSPLNIGRSNSGSYLFGGLLDEVAVYGTALSAARVRAHHDAGLVADIVPPTVTLATPGDGTAAATTTPSVTGGAGTAPGDAATVTISIYGGRDALGTPLQTLTASVQPDGSWAAAPSTLGTGTYTAQARQFDAAGNAGVSSANTFSVGAPAPPRDRTMLTAGDIASCTEVHDTDTGLLLGNFPGEVVQTLGDNAYPAGTASDFANCYEPTWGGAKDRTRPAYGGHDYGDMAGGSLQGNLDYFSATLALLPAGARDPARGYYSYDIGSWHVVVLNAACSDYATGCSETEQERWLRADLASRPADCTMAIMHNPLFTSGSATHSGDPTMLRYWQALYDGGADLVLSGHNHQYERFAPQRPDGTADPTYGIREFVVGTGGADLYAFTGTAPNSEARSDTTWGVLRLTLHPTGYDWTFVPIAGQTFTDSGSAPCHGAPPQ